MCGGLKMSNLRISDAPPSWDFNLGESRWGGGCKWYLPEIPEISFLYMPWLKMVAVWNWYCMVMVIVLTSQVTKRISHLKFEPVEPIEWTWILAIVASSGKSGQISTRVHTGRISHGRGDNHRSISSNWPPWGTPWGGAVCPKQKPGGTPWPIRPQKRNL